MAHYFIDITSDFCPITFVRTKLMIEKIRAGDQLEVRLRGVEPLNNVQRSVTELGHLLLSVSAEVESAPQGVYRLLIEKAGDSVFANTTASVPPP